MPINKFFIRYSTRLVNTRPSPSRYYYRLTCLWGLFLLLPFSTFDNPAFVIMREYAPKWFWGTLIFLIGYRLRSAFLSGRTQHIRDALFGTTVLWLYITTMIVVANTHGTGVVVYPLLTYYIAREYLIYSARYSILKQEKDIEDVSN